MDTTTALRMGLALCLADGERCPLAPNEQEHWRDRLKQRERTLGMPDEQQALIQMLVQWTDGKHPSVNLALRRALGEEIERDPVPGTTKAPASVSAPTEAQTPQGESLMQTDSIAPSEQKDSHMPPPAIDEDKLARIIASMQQPDSPYWAPQDTGRLADAEALFRAGKVTCDSFGLYHVTGSRDPKTKQNRVYTIDKECTCDWVQKNTRTKWCKHLTATVIYRKYHAPLHQEEPLLLVPRPTAEERLAQPPIESYLPPDEAEYMPEPEASERVVGVVALASPPVSSSVPTTITHEGTVMHEAPYSATVSVEDEDGYELLLTVRKVDGKEFFKAVTGLRAWCKTQKLKPHTRHGRPRVTPDVTESPPATSGPDAPPAAPVCPYHGPMKASDKAPGTWYCPKKMGDGTYCKERTAQKGN